MNYSAIYVKDLWVSAFDVTSQHYDFSEGYGSEWEIPFDQTDTELESGDYDPMMNYRYELPDNFKMPDNVKELLDKAGAVTLVYFSEEETY